MKCPKCSAENPDTKSFCADCGAPLTLSEGKPLPQAKPTMTLETPVEALTRGILFADRYEIIEELGRGGMGRVYRVEDKKIGQEVALKLIKPEIASDVKTLERFRNELKNARMISHKNVCRMFDLGETRSAYYITMEYVSGEDLKSLIRKVGRLDTDTAVKMARQICEGLAEAHRLGVVHRDLKPSNILIDREGSARIMDFGIARSLKAKGMTGTGVVIGTPEYMSPEQAEAKGLDQRSDLYSLGVILYEMVTGRLPFEGDTPLSIAMKHKGEEPEAPAALNPQVPVDLSRLILKCLAKDKADRYESAGEIVEALNEIENNLPSTLRGESARKSAVKTVGKKTVTSKEVTLSITPKKVVGIAAAVAVLIAALVGLLLWSPWSNKTPVAASKIENSIAVIGFENQTGDTAYDHLQKVFPNLLITNLEATGLFHVLTWERMRDLSRQVREDGGNVIDQDLGFEICRREGIEALVIGTFTKLGKMFATDIKVYEVYTKNSLSSASSSGEGEESILETQIDELSREIVESLGSESGQKEGEVALHIAEGTTSSLEAYNLYLSGVELSEQLYLEDARQALENAVAIDPSFASAYMELSYIYIQLENPGAQIEALKKALEFSEGVTEKEKLYIDAAYAASVDMSYQKSVGMYQALLAKFPREKKAYFWLGSIHYFWGATDKAIESYAKALGLDPRYGQCMNMIAYAYAAKNDYAMAIDYFKRYAALSPGQANPHDSLAEAYFMTGRLDESLKEYKEALRIKPDFVGSRWKVAYIYALKEDYFEALKWIDQFIEQASVPGLQALAHFWKGLYLYLLGNEDQALAELRVAEDLAISVKNGMMHARIQGLRGWLYLGRGELDLSREGFRTLNTFVHDEFPAIAPIYDGMYHMNLGMINLKEGDVDSAKKHIEGINDLSEIVAGTDTEWKSFYHNLLHGEVLLAEGFQEEAAVVGKRLSTLKYPFTLSDASGILYNMPFCKDLAARAYVASGNLAAAVAEYERLIVFDQDEPIHFLISPLYHYRLGLLYEQQGLDEKAQQQYATFLEQWKDADPNHESVKDARSRISAPTTAKY